MSDATISIRDGSSLYYSLLWTESPIRQRFAQRLTLIKALATTLDDVQEPQVAEKKIHWWHEELQRLTDGSARHPATQQNQEHLLGLEKAQTACLDIVSVAATQRFTPASTNEENDANIVKSYRARLALLAHALSNVENDLEADSHTHLAALGFGQYEQLVRLPNLIHRGLPVFSDELYKQFGIRPNDLAELIRIDASASHNSAASDETSAPAAQPAAGSRLAGITVSVDKPGRRQLLAYVIASNQSTLGKAVSDKLTTQRYRTQPLLPIWRLLVLRKHQLDLWSKHQPNLLRERTTLTPLAKLFRAWQNRR